MLDLLLSLVVPRVCAGCGSPGRLWCEPCIAELEPVGMPACARCGAPTRWAVTSCRECAGWEPAFATAWAAVAHRGSGAALVHVWKDRGLDLADVAARAIEERHVPPDADCLCPVPASPGRARARGVDGPAALAAALGRRWEIPVAPHLLVRARDAPPQRGLDRRARRGNLRGVFTACGRSPRRVALVDDVYTTGATADACARALRRAGAARVDALAFARALRDR